MNPLEDASCVGMHWLFDSTDLRDHIAARHICSTCPARTACDDLLKQVQRDTRSRAAAGGGPQGTWAGKLYGSKGLIASCGTDSGYRRHQRNDEQPCTDCKRAHSEATNRHHAKTRSRK